MNSDLNQLSFSDECGWTINFKGRRYYSVYQSIHRSRGQIYGYEALLRRICEYGFDEGHAPVMSGLTRSERSTLEFCSLIIHVKNFPKGAKKRLFINVSPNVLLTLARDCDAMNYLIELIEQKGMSLGQVCLEVTEQQCDDENSLTEVCDYCRGIGLGIAIDDYGKGGSDCHRAERLKPGVLKVDSELLDRYMRMDRAPLLGALQLAQQIGSAVIVEGIDSLEKLLAMKRHKVVLLQGYYLGYPRDLLTQRELEAASF